MEGHKGKVCVTGGTGFIASWMIKRLLENGYSVSTTIRPDPENKRDISFLKNLPGASEKLRIFEADLSDPDSFNEAIEECTGVFHVATPIDFENKEPEEVVVRRTIDGALGILKACLKSKTIKRIVYTSSVAAVVVNGKEEDFMDESYWTDVDYVKSVIEYGRSYFISKTLTEKAVLEFAEEHGLDLVTVLPPCVVGPFICPKLPGSVRVALALILGEQSQYPALLNIGMVHVDDVSRAHMFLLETPNVKGRYNCSSHTLTIQEMASFLSANYPEFPIPTIESLKEIKGPKFPFVSSKKLLDAGFKFEYGLDDMFDHAIKCCKEKGYL